MRLASTVEVKSPIPGLCCGDETCRLNGMDDFLTAITPLLEAAGDDAGGDPNEYRD